MKATGWMNSYTLKRFLLSALIGSALLFTSCSLLARPRGPSVVLIIIDTMRPDHLGSYGYSLPTSPNIDRLASEGTLFKQAVTPVPMTLPSICAMFTSTYPVSNKVRSNGRFFLSDSSVTLAEILKERGYETAAFIGGFPLDSRFRANQGFDIYDDDFSASVLKHGTRQWTGHEVSVFERLAREVNEKVFPWLEKVKGRQFFLTVHYFDPHAPYEPPKPYDERFENPYDGEVAYTDEAVGELLGKLEELGLTENTLIVLTGDHGESLGAHDESTHGLFVFDTTVLIPLILWHKDKIPKGLEVDTMVRSIDIGPTILDFLDVPDNPNFQGSSLLPALEGKLEEKPILLETLFPYYESDFLGSDPVRISGLRTGEWKIVLFEWSKNGQPVVAGELYNVVLDPLEVFNVAGENRETFSRLLNEMRSLTQQYSAESVAENTSMEMDEETKQKLRGLGYLQ